jgi:predicted enzyme related to lactoylglutathione lyase
MPNLAYFEIPADNVGRAKKFSKSLLGWTIEPTSMPTAMPANMEYQDVKTGEPKEGTLRHGWHVQTADARDPYRRICHGGGL